MIETKNEKLKKWALHMTGIKIDKDLQSRGVGNPHAKFCKMKRRENE